MSKFVFKVSQRVFLPVAIDGPNVQAVITARKEFAWREPEYDLQWLLADTFGPVDMPDQRSLLGHNMAPLSESVLIGAQPVVAPSDIKSTPHKRRAR